MILKRNVLNINKYIVLLGVGNFYEYIFQKEDINLVILIIDCGKDDLKCIFNVILYYIIKKN